MSADDGNDDLLRRARELRQRAERRQHGSSGHGSAVGRLISDSAWFNKAAATLETITRYLGPIGSVLGWMAGLIGRWLRWAAFRPLDSDGDGKTDDLDFSLKRLMWTLPVSLAALIGVHVAWSAVYFYATYFEETVFVTGKQEIETGELYQFGGCTSLPCSTETDNGKFYLVESSLYFPVLYYPEEDVFANIPQQNGACQVRGYGLYFRTLRWLYKSLQLYQHVTNVSCRPYTEEEIRRAVDYGEIVTES